MVHRTSRGQAVRKTMRHFMGATKPRHVQIFYSRSISPTLEHEIPIASRVTRCSDEMAVCFYLTVLLVLIAFGVESAPPGKNHSLYLLSLISYPNNDTSLDSPPNADLNAIIQGAYLAISDINNRSDVLADYRLELVAAESACNIDWVGVINLIHNLYYAERKQIVGIVGPRCSDSAKSVAYLAGRPEIALLNVHFGSAPELANRNLYPYSYGIRPPTSVVVDAIVALFSYKKWTRASVLYNPKMLVDYNSFLLFEQKIAGIANISFTSPASPTYLPLEELRRSYVRVIVSFLRAETLQRVLCSAYYKNMTYPRYQWILFVPSDGSNVSFMYQDEQYECSGEHINMALNQSIQVTINNRFDTGPTISDIDPFTFDDVCPYPELANCFILFDAVWALALALNNSVEPLRVVGLSLSSYTYGKYAHTQIIQQQMNMLSFNGQWGAVQFNSSTGYISIITCVLLQSENMIGNFTFPDGVLEINSGAAVFLSTDFETKLITVSLPLAVVVIVMEAVAAILVILVQVLNTVYRDSVVIKASSTRLNHFAYVGCYVILIGVLLYTIMESFNIGEYADSVLCNMFPWTLITGLTLVFATVAMKTWRLYYIFHSSLQNKKPSRVVAGDRALIVAIAMLVGFGSILCLVWTLYDPLVRKADSALTPVEDNHDLLLIMKETCSCRHEVVWIVVGIIYEAMLIIFIIIFAIAIRNPPIKELQSQSTIFMAYFLTPTCIVGGVIYYITKAIEVDTDVPFGILCFALLIIVYLCIILLFLPPVLPIIKGWPVVKKWSGIKNMPIIRNLPCWSGNYGFKKAGTNST